MTRGRSNTLNLDLRSEYVKDCENGLKRWNRIIEQAGVGRPLSLPHVGFNRQVGLFWATENPGIER